MPVKNLFLKHFKNYYGIIQVKLVHPILLPFHISLHNLNKVSHNWSSYHNNRTARSFSIILFVEHSVQKEFLWGIVEYCSYNSLLVCEWVFWKKYFFHFQSHVCENHFCWELSTWPDKTFFLLVIFSIWDKLDIPLLDITKLIF